MTLKEKAVAVLKVMYELSGGKNFHFIKVDEVCERLGITKDDPVWAYLSGKRLIDRLGKPNAVLRAEGIEFMEENDDSELTWKDYVSIIALKLNEAGVTDEEFLEELKKARFKTD